MTTLIQELYINVLVRFVSDSYTDADVIYSWLNADSVEIDPNLQIPQYTLVSWDQGFRLREYSTGKTVYFYINFSEIQGFLAL